MEADEMEIQTPNEMEVEPEEEGEGAPSKPKQVSILSVSNLWSLLFLFRLL